MTIQTNKTKMLEQMEVEGSRNSGNSKLKLKYTVLVGAVSCERINLNHYTIPHNDKSQGKDRKPLIQDKACQSVDK